MAGPAPFLLTEKEPNRVKEALGHQMLSKVYKGKGLVAQPGSSYLRSASDSICTMSKNVVFDIFKELKVDAQYFILNRVYEFSEAKISSDEFLRTFCGKKYEPCHSLVPNFGSSNGIEVKHSGMEDNIINVNKILRHSIIAIASAELGIKEATDNNDGERIEEYLRYTNLSKGYEWCASFVSWAYGQAGLLQPRNPWSPALFPKARLILKDQHQQADVFGVYGVKVKRINHVGMIKEKSNNYFVTIEGNSNNRVESRRRHLRTIFAIADWVSGNQS